jgi:hypothetical protein
MGCFANWRASFAGARLAIPLSISEEWPDRDTHTRRPPSLNPFFFREKAEPVKCGGQWVEVKSQSLFLQGKS